MALASVTDISTKKIKKGGVTNYPIEEKFALQIALLLCKSDKLWYAVGQYMELNLVEDIRFKEVLRAVKHLRGENLPMGSVTAVVQQIHSRLTAGSITQEQFESICEALDKSETELEAEPLSEETAVALLAEPVAAVTQSNLVSELVLLNGKGKEISPTLAKLNDLDKIGHIEVVDSPLMIDDSIWEKFKALNSQSRLRTGVPDLDLLLDGGPPPASVMVWGGDAKDGKSAAMLQQCAAAVLEGKRCLFIAIEMGATLSMSRFLASLLGLSIRDIQTASQSAQNRLAGFLATKKLDNLMMRQLSPGCTPSDVKALVEEAIKQFGKIDCIFLDYADRMSGGKRGESDYEAMKIVYNFLDRMAIDLGCWVVTASQLQRQDKAKGPPGVGSLADSHWKIRIAHLVVNIFKCDPDKPIMRGLHVAAYRHGSGGDTLDGIVTDFGHMRLAPCHYLPKVA